jgi:sugar O-acyltransferase (sialic acid O-acetyltransferase NeuD family)
MPRYVLRSAPPASCRRILIVGAGGFGREVLQWTRDAWPDHAELLAGFLSDDATRLAGHDCGLAIVASVDAYVPRDGDRLLFAIGLPECRRRVAESLLARGAEFLTLVHPTAVVCPSAQIGCGSIVCPHAIVSDAARLGRFVILNWHASAAHDADVGDFAVLSPFAAVAGGARVGAGCFLGTHASLAPGRSLGAGSRVSANSAVGVDVAADSIAFGVPATIRRRLVPQSDQTAQEDVT